jgi:hypothetical protein
VRKPVVALLAAVVVAASGQRPARAQASPTVTTTVSQFKGLTFDDPFSLRLTATGGAPPYTWSLAPRRRAAAGLSLTPEGVISGRPSAGGVASRSP